MNYNNLDDKRMNNIDFAEAFDRQRGLNMQAVFPALMRKVYGWMTLALVITGLTAFMVASSPGLVQAIYGSGATFLILAIAELGVVIYLTARLDRLSLTSATLWFVVYSILNGVTLSYIFLAYTMTSITEVFFITAGTFAAMAVVGSVTKRDLTKLGGILFMALIGLIIASLVNIFMRNTMFDLVISCVGVLVFVGLTAWDAQKIKQALMMAPDTSESSQKVALIGALSLYLDFINIFLYLLRLFGRSDN